MNLTTDELKKLKTGLFKLMDDRVNSKNPELTDPNVVLQAAESLIRLIQLSCHDVVEGDKTEESEDELAKNIQRLIDNNQIILRKRNIIDLEPEHIEPDTPWPRK